MEPFNKKEKNKEFRGFYVDVTRSGGDVVKAFRKLKRMYKDTKFFDQLRDKQYYQKPSEIKREAHKNKLKTLRKLRREQKF